MQVRRNNGHNSSYGGYDGEQSVSGGLEQQRILSSTILHRNQCKKHMDNSKLERFQIDRRMCLSSDFTNTLMTDTNGNTTKDQSHTTATRGSMTGPAAVNSVMLTQKL